MVKKFRTRPVEIEAQQFTGDNWSEMLAFTGHRRAQYNPDYLIPNFAPIGSYIPKTDEIEKEGITAEVFDVLHYTWMGVKPGQWVVRVAKG